MPLFEYKAIKDNGQPVQGTLEAAYAGAVFEYLEKQNFVPIKIAVKKQPLRINIPFLKKRSKIKDEEILNYTKQLVTLLKAGVPIISSIEALRDQADNKEFKEVLQQIHDDIESGSNFSDALKKHPKVFSPLYTNTVKAGEAGGALDQVLERIGMLMAYETEIRQKIKGATRYPIFVIIGIAVAFIILMTFVVPQFVEMFGDAELPTLTKGLINVSNFLKGFWWVYIPGIVGMTMALIFYIGTPKGRFNFDKFKLKVPIFGNLFMKSAMSRFSHMFETLNKSGLPILQTMEIVSTTIGNVVISKELEIVGIGIEKGRGISGPMKESGLFPPLVIRMISVGEQSGSLDEMLHNVSEHYDNEVNYLVENLVSLIEPILTISIGAMVLVLALGIFLPMWSMMDAFGG